MHHLFFVSVGHTAIEDKSWIYQNKTLVRYWPAPDTAIISLLRSFLTNKGIISGNEISLFEGKELVNNESIQWAKSFRIRSFYGPYFPVFGLNMEIVNLRIQSEYLKIRIRKNSSFGHFSRSGSAATVEFEQTLT